MTETMQRLGAPADQEHGLADALPGWRAFPEVHGALVEARDRGWKLAVLSNTDDDFIAASQVQIGVLFDEVVVAQEIGSYKPGHKHWEEFFARTRAPKEGHVHVAASLFHDVRPCNELGLRSVWVNRLAETAPSDARPQRELTDLFALPETLDDLVGS
jgi:2-haloacid dehalogenase